MLIYGVKTKLIHTGDDLVEAAIEGAALAGNPIRNRDLIVYSAKVVGAAQGRLVNLSKVVPSSEALKLSKLYHLQPSFAEQIIKEADSILGGVYHAVLTLKRGILVPNAGIDQSNAPKGYVALWPADPQSSAEAIRTGFIKRGMDIGVLVIDSWVLPLRIGSSAVTLGVAGFNPVVDLRGTNDLFKRKMRMKRIAVADSLAASANMVMGETVESTPIAVIRDAGVVFEEGHIADELLMPVNECLIMHFLNRIRDEKNE